jgi:hypothetical protein
MLAHFHTALVNLFFESVLLVCGNLCLLSYKFDLCFTVYQILMGWAKRYKNQCSISFVGIN